MIKIALLDPHPVVHKGFKAFFRKNDNICVVNTFSKTKDQHNKAKREFQKLRRKIKRQQTKKG